MKKALALLSEVTALDRVEAAWRTLEEHFVLNTSIERVFRYSRGRCKSGPAHTIMADVGVKPARIQNSVLQTEKRGHDGEPLLVHGRPLLLRAYVRCRSDIQVDHSSFFHLDATLKLSRWDLRQENQHIIKRQYLIPVLWAQLSDGVGHQVLCSAPCSHLLALHASSTIARFDATRLVRR